MKRNLKFFLLAQTFLISFISQAIFNTQPHKINFYQNSSDQKDQKKNKKALKYDSTLKVGKIGYDLFCLNNKNDINYLKLKLVGFKTDNNPNKTQLQLELPIKGKVLYSEIDDVDNDGNPDLLIFIQPNQTNYVSVLAIRSVDNENIEPIDFPDILDDKRLREFYKGNDSYSLLEGTLIRSFPIITDTVSPTPQIKYMKIIYRVVPGLNNIRKFKPVKDFISDKQ